MTAYSDSLVFGPGDYLFLVECPAFPKDLQVSGRALGGHCGGRPRVDVESRVTNEGFLVHAVCSECSGEIVWRYEV